MNIVIPLDFFSIKYNEANNPSYQKEDIFKIGGNCQLFAYMFLQYHGFPLLKFRSDELWHDQKYTRKVRKIKLFDLVLFNKTNDPYGAHIGIFIGDNEILHLSKQVGYPTIWDMSEFKKYMKYKIIIGAKRVKRIVV